MPAIDDPAVRKQRLDIYLSFLGPAGFATPDDNEVMELIQKNCAGLPDEAMIDCSRGMTSANPKPQDEAQMRAFWREWRTIMAPTAGASLDGGRRRARRAARRDRGFPL